MKKYIRLGLTIISASLITLAGCYKDKGNYIYHKLNELRIIVPKDSVISVLQFDTLHIEPQVNQATPDKKVLKYEWYAYSSSGLPRIQKTILAATKDLNVQIGFPPRAERYNLIYKVTDTTTGISAFHHYYFKVSSPISAGWMVLEDGVERADIDMISLNDNVFYHLFSAANPDKLLPLSSKIIASLNTGWGQFNYVFFNNGGYLLDRLTFQVTSNYSNLFYQAPEVLRPESIVYPPGSNSSLLVNDGSVYSQQFLYGATHIGGRYAGDYHATPYVVSDLFYDAFFFDDKNERFVYVGIFGTSISLFPPRTSSQAFDLNHINKTILTLLPSYQDNKIALFKNKNNDSCFLYTMNLRSDAIAIDSQYIKSSETIQKSNLFATSTSVPLLYYAVGNKVYVYDMPANRSRVIYEFPSDEQSTVLKINYTGDRLVVATYDGQQGRVYYLDLAPTGDVKGNIYTKKFEGFGKVLDITYKYG